MEIIIIIGDQKENKNNDRNVGVYVSTHQIS